LTCETGAAGGARRHGPTRIQQDQRVRPARGHARVSTEEQGTDPQRHELRAAGCTAILEEHASGADRGRPVLARLLRDIRPGDTLVVVRLDRLARSVGHLLAVIEQLEAGGAPFRSLRDPIDTATPQGMFSLQVLGAVAQLERALIAERTKAGLHAARARGRVGGNPGLRDRDPAAIRKLRASRDAKHLDGVLAQLNAWLPTVRRMRPVQPWGGVARALNHAPQASPATPEVCASAKPEACASATPEVRAWTVEKLRRTVQRLAREGIVEPDRLGRARRQNGDDRLVRLVAGLKAAAPERTLQQIATQLEAMRERTPRGGTRWHSSSVRHLLGRAEQLGLAGEAAGSAAAKVAPGVWR
jgi:DNA invertase Pin-like site-specific DNA recombinase